MAETGDETRDEKRQETERDEEDRGQALKGEAEGEHAREGEQTRERDDDDGKRRPGKKLWIPLVIVGLVGLLVLFIASRGNEATKKAGEQNSPVIGAALVQKRFAGVEQSGLTLGNPAAPVTLVQFADLQCPQCKKASDTTLSVLLDRYVRAGRLRVEFRNLPILGPDSDRAARALDAAAAQNKAWQFIDLWYLNQGVENAGYVTDSFIRQIARGAGLDAEQVVTAARGTETPKSVATADKDAKEFGVTETPSYLIGRTGQEYEQLLVQDPANPDLFAQAIDRQLAQQE